ncbi:carbon-nitrogen hydrolase family protein [Rhodovibrio salinarum]|uniref:Carbon-nitrogen hydrolase n=1 Tax=Rhodovibrio salinarum TaxID=1087 RepID=A0A934QL58_9PROT|nr:carbon-nitrogen hydrolase family protein [Rhodovibrio salinarum]MBK1698544.1 carbon-nitrogen hydrolase [Rhodovibrio salinarum]
MRLAVAQTAGVSGDPQATLAQLPEIAGQARAQGARLLVLPEMWLTGYNIAGRTAALAEPADGDAARAVAAVACQHDLAILYGFPERADGAIYNAAQLITPDGAARVCYRKAHLFGEAERAQFAPGASGAAHCMLDGLRLAILICYDVEFPEMVRAAALQGADAVLVPTALFQPFDFVARTLVPVRACENGVYLAYANRCGQEGTLTYVGGSVICGPDGTVLTAAGGDPDLLFADLSRSQIDRARSTNPYLRDRRPELYG